MAPGKQTGAGAGDATRPDRPVKQWKPATT